MSGSIAARAYLTMAVIGFLAPVTSADTITVCWDGSGDYLTIQEGIDAASDGDEVVVCPGTYNEVINFNGKAIRLRSSDGPDVTIIDGTGLNDSVVKCVSGEGPDTVLDGFTITGGTGDPSYSPPPTTVGGGMVIEGSSPTLANCRFVGNVSTGPDGSGGGLLIATASPTIIDCVISDNESEISGGGGIMCASSSDTLATFINCTISSNSAAAGGAIQFYYCRGLLMNCTFEDNSATTEGGALQIGGRTNTDATMVNCVFTGNTAAISGGALSTNDYGRPTLINCTLSGNSATSFGALHTRDGGSAIVATNCVIWDNGPNPITAVTATYSNIEGGWPGEGNIDADPLFAAPDNGDYRLSGGSPCIDAGDNTAVPPDWADLDDDGDTAERTPLDLDGNARFVDDPLTDDTGVPDPPLYPGIVDMGAYEFPVCPGDVDGDGDVDLSDLALLLAVYGSCAGDPEYETVPRADVDGNGCVELADLAILLANYGTTCE